MAWCLGGSMYDLIKIMEFSHQSAISGHIKSLNCYTKFKKAMLVLFLHQGFSSQQVACGPNAAHESFLFGPLNPFKYTVSIEE